MNTDLPAGRELDALVAEKVMGLIWDEKRCRVCGWPLVEEGGPGCWPSNCSMRPMPERRADAHAPYSTDIAAAWTVVEKLDTDLWLIQVTRKTGMNERFLRWWVELRSLKDLARDPFEVAGDSAPLAICRAALKAVESAR